MRKVWQQCKGAWESNQKGYWLIHQKVNSEHEWALQPLPFLRAGLWFDHTTGRGRSLETPGTTALSVCLNLYIRLPPALCARAACASCFPSPRFTVIFRLYRDATVSRAALSACSLCWFPPAWHSGLTTDSARHLHLWKSNYITYNGFGRSKEKQLSVIKCAEKNNFYVTEAQTLLKKWLIPINVNKEKIF